MNKEYALQRADIGSYQSNMKQGNTYHSKQYYRNANQGSFNSRNSVYGGNFARNVARSNSKFQTQKFNSEI